MSAREPRSVAGWWETLRSRLFATSRSRLPRHRPGRLTVEALEDRTLPAGSVTATFLNGSLFLHGDAAANDVSVLIDTVPNQVTIVGYDDTTIFGPTTGIVTKGVTIDLGAGANRVTVTGELEGPLGVRSALASLRILLGIGADTILIDSVRVTTSLAIDTGKGDDSVSLNHVWAGSVSVITGDGKDQVGFGGVPRSDEPDTFWINGTFTVDTGAGRDQVTSFGNTVILGLTRIRTGAGNDYIGLSGSYYDDLARFRNLWIDSGMDDDKVSLSGIQAQATTILTGAGRDLVQFAEYDGGVQILGPLLVNTGDGIDGIICGGLTAPPVYLKPFISEFFGKVTFATGNGTDVLQLDNVDFYGPVNALMGAGKDFAVFGRGVGGLSFDGPLLLAMGGNNDIVSIGVPGYRYLSGYDLGLFPPNGLLLGFTHLNGPVTVLGGVLRTTVYLNPENASFNGGLRMRGAKLVSQPVTATNVLEAPRVTVVDGQTGTFLDQQQRTFVTNYSVTQDASGAVTVTPVFTTLWTGFSLDVAAVVSSDRRFVDLDVHLIKKTIADPVETMTITTPIGRQTIQLPVVNTIDGHTKVSVPDGGTILVSGIKRLTESRPGVELTRDASSLMMMITPRVIVDEESLQGLQVAVEVRLIEITQPNMVPGWNGFTNPEDWTWDWS